MAVPKYCKFSLRTLEAQRTCLTSAQGDRLLTAGCRARPPPAWLFDDASHTHRSPAGEVPSEPRFLAESVSHISFHGTRGCIYANIPKLITICL